LTEQLLMTGKDLDHEATEKKFKAFDEVFEREGMTKPIIELLDNPTLYEYAFFRDDNGSPFKLTTYQDVILSDANNHDFTAENPSRYILFRASNQLGKSRSLRAYARFLALTKKNVNIVLISKSLPQSQFLLAEIRRELNNSAFAGSWREDVGETANTTMLTFEPEKGVINRIICAPAGEGALGYPIHYLFLDEADFYEESHKLFWKVFFARTKQTKGQIILFSNPNPDVAKSESLLYQLWKGDLFNHKYHFSFLDAPWNSVEEFERDRRNSPAHIFASTHLGDWSEEGGAFFSQSELDDMFNKDWRNNSLPAVTEPVYIGMDLGKMRDNTVITVGVSKKPVDSRDKYNDLDVVYHEVLPLGTTYEKVVNRYVEIKRYYDDNYGGVAAMGFDATGQKTFQDLLKIKGVSGIPVDFSSRKSNKTLLYNDFKLMAENRKLKISYSDVAYRQLANLQFKYTKTKQLMKVENKTDSIHDDVADSIAVLIHVAVKPSHIKPSVTVVSAKKEEVEDKNYKTTHEEAEANGYYAQVIKDNQDYSNNSFGGFF